MVRPMGTGSRVCPHCGALNSVDEARCHRCERTLPGPLRSAAEDLVRSGLGTEFPVTRLLIALCVLVFLLSSLGKGPFPIWPSQGIRTSEAIRWGALLVPAVPGEPWRHLSAVFVHANALHLLLNMLALLSLGRGAEAALGWRRFTVAFVGSGWLGYLISHAWYAAWGGRGALLVGASGAIFGLLGVEAGLLLARRAWDARARLWRALGLAAVIGLMMPVNNSAHLGGLAAGLAIGYGLGRERLRQSHERVFGVLATALLLASLASVVLSTRSPVWRAEREYEIATGRE
jgi:rhomboid protease GluP